jgi:sugar/nucleoside kinase (ribokinase family)
MLLYYSMNFDFLTIGGLTEDIVFFTDEGVLVANKGDLLKQKLLAFEYGAKIKIKEFGYYFGGGASNTAVNLSNLGFRVASLSKIGPEERGKRILDNLKKKKIDVKNIEIDKKNNSGFSFILNNKKDRVIFSYRGSNDLLRVERKHKDIIRSSSWVYLTSMPDFYYNSLKNIFSFKNKIAWNPGLKQLSGGAEKISIFLEKTDVLMLNKDESLELIKKTKKYKKLKNSYLNNCHNLIKILKELGPDKIILTNGVKGAYFYDGNKVYHQGIIKGRQAIDTTGVGDAFNSTIIAFLERFKGDIKKAMFLAAKNTASVVSYSGAQNGLLSFKKLIK